MPTPAGYTSWRAWVTYGVPWAIVLFWVVIGYAVVERLNDNLTSSDLLDAAVAAGVLTVGHSVHHAVHYRRQHESKTDPWSPR
jgi:hypothetical protein